MTFPASLGLALILLAAARPALAQARPATPVDDAYVRAAALVRDGQGEAGRQIVDSVFVRTRTGTPEHAEALFWRAALAMDAQQAESDYRRLVVEYPLSPRVDRALLSLAQLELARNDRERALTHLVRIEREHPAGEARAMAAFWTARVRFDMNDAPRACASLDDALRLAAPGDVELQNQAEFYRPRCDGVVRASSADEVGARGTGVGGNRNDTARSAVDSTVAPVSRPPAAVSAPDSRPPSPDAVTPRRTYSVQIAAYETAAEAEALVRRLRARNVTARVSGTVKPFRVRTGNHATRAEANAALRELRARGIHGFVVDESATASP
jgi:cell division septation protein DedD